MSNSQHQKFLTAADFRFLWTDLDDSSSQSYVIEVDLQLSLNTLSSQTYREKDMSQKVLNFSLRHEKSFFL